ncbi:MAG: OmpA family protein [Paracoccaceae bacterium]
MPSITRSLARAVAGALLALGLPLAAAATGLDLSLPGGARPTAERVSDPGSHAMPVGPWAEGEVPAIRAEGLVTRQAWRVPGRAFTTLQILGPLRDQLLAAGFEIAFECEAQTCGGFDFRFATEVLPVPAMHVDLTRYRYLSALRATDGAVTDHVSVLVSRSMSAGFVQIVHVSASDGGLAVRDDAEGLPPEADTPLLEELVARGHAVLDDLSFETGSSELEGGDYVTLGELAAWLRSNPARKVALVGHTDAVGALENNIALSRQRAQSVRARLVTRHDVPETQLQAEGMGYLAPVASNLTGSGRQANRRVEAVLIAAD